MGREEEEQEEESVPKRTLETTAPEANFNRKKDGGGKEKE